MTFEINKETLDFLRDQLSESVRKSAEEALFKFYRNSFAIIMAVLTAVGLSVGWPTLKALVQSEIHDRVEKPVGDATAAADRLRSQINQLQTEADIRLERMKSQLATVDAKLDLAEDLQRRARAKIDDADQKLMELGAAIDQKYKDLEVAVSSRSHALDDKYASAGAFATATAQLSSLSDALRGVDADLRKLAASVGQPIAASDAHELITTSQSIKATEESSASKVSKPTVFVQFAGGSRSQIQKLTTLLKQGGTFDIPGEERLASAANKHEIRYYYAEDLPTATRLQSESTSAAKQLQFPVQNFDLVPLLDYPKKPLRGVIELWIEVPQ